MSTISNEVKNSSTLTNEGKSNPPARFGVARFGVSRFGDAAGVPDITEETKHSSSISQETSH